MEASNTGLPSAKLAVILAAFNSLCDGNVSELARRAQSDRSYVSEVLNGHVVPGMKVASRLARVLDLPLDTFRFDDGPFPAHDRVPVEVVDRVVVVPIVAEASAGRGSGARTGGAVKVAASEAAGRKLIAVRIRGTCMGPRFQTGDVVIFEKVTDDEVMNGDTVLITLLDLDEDGAYLVKYFEWARNGEEKVVLTAEDNTRIEALYDRVVIEGRYWRMQRD